MALRRATVQTTQILRGHPPTAVSLDLAARAKPNLTVATLFFQSRSIVSTRLKSPANETLMICLPVLSVPILRTVSKRGSAENPTRGQWGVLCASGLMHVACG